MSTIIHRFPPLEWDPSWEIYDYRQLGGAIEQLTERDLAILGLIADGCTNREIAERLGGTAAEIKTETRAMPAKLGVKSLRDVVMTACAHGYLGPRDGDTPPDQGTPPIR